MSHEVPQREAPAGLLLFAQPPFLDSKQFLPPDRGRPEKIT